jgi:hypothetical protein
MSEHKIDLRDHDGFTVRADCQAFVITGSCGLAGAAALRVGLRVRKRSGMRVLGLPSGTQPSGTQPPGTQAQNTHVIG